MKNELASFCLDCSLGCGVKTKPVYSGQEIRLDADFNHPFSGGLLCEKGTTLHNRLMDDKSRLTHPQMRWNKNAPLESVSWETALTRAAGVFKGIMNNYGADSVGFYVSGKLSTEELYWVNKLAKGFIKTNHIDTDTRLVGSSSEEAFERTYGTGSPILDLSILEFTDVILLSGSNLALSQPVLMDKILLAKKVNPNLKIIAVDPRITKTTQLCDLHLRPQIASDTYLFFALAQIIIEKKNFDKKYIETQTEGFADFQKAANLYSLSEISSICKISTEDIQKAASWIGGAKSFLNLYGLGITQSPMSQSKVLSLLNLSMLKGQINSRNNQVAFLSSITNHRGVLEVGVDPGKFVGRIPIEDLSFKPKLEAFWQTQELSTCRGKTAVEMFDGLLDGSIKAIWIMGTNPLESLPDSRKVEAALKKAKFVIVQDSCQENNALAFADLILPSSKAMEKEGVYTSQTGLVSLNPKVLDPPGLSLSDAQIISEFAQKMGFKRAFAFSSYDKIYQEHIALSQLIDGKELLLNHQVLKEKPQFLDLVGFFENKEAPAKKANFFDIDPKIVGEKPSENYPLILTTSTLGLKEPLLEIHPIDAEIRGIKSGDLVEVSNIRANCRVKAWVSENTKPGLVCMDLNSNPSGYSDLARTNNLTSSALEYNSYQPQYKYTPVEVSLFQPEAFKILVLGFGSAAKSFLKVYASENKKSTIEIFPIENFQSLTQLPDLLLGNKNLEVDFSAWEILGAKFHLDIQIVEINPEQKYLLDQKGEKYKYDLLVVNSPNQLSVGSDVPLDKINFITQFSESKLNYLKESIEKKQPIVIIGGGFLGIEIADYFLEKDCPVHLVQLSDRILSGQIDSTASELLYQKFQEKGLNMHLGDEVVAYLGEETFQSIQLKSGQIIPLSAVIYAEGFGANLTLFRNAQIECQKGILVNHQLKTSDPFIFALGEIAELESFSLNVPNQSQEQGEVLSKVFLGDPSAKISLPISSYILQTKHIELSFAGLVQLPKQEKGKYQEISAVDLSRGYYKKCIIKKNQLVGVILVGSNKEFSFYEDLINSGRPLENIRDTLLNVNFAQKSRL
ncbi:MAG: hypothetical protein C4K58_04190 [Flavobacteriaceae bacterium]|nr:MAG: hypothetical protein C4K58_04190 [Flavobacteriaceae bacterium]